VSHSASSFLWRFFFHDRKLFVWVWPQASILLISASITGITCVNHQFPAAWGYFPPYFSKAERVLSCKSKDISLGSCSKWACWKVLPRIVSKRHTKWE
jgi:hypothetical protein